MVAIRVKADRYSKNMSALSQASKGVTQATGGVVATAKACGKMIEENGNVHALFHNVYACVCTHTYVGIRKN